MFVPASCMLTRMCLLNTTNDANTWHGISWRPMISQVSLKGFGQQAKVAHCMTGILWDKFPTLFAASFASIWINSQACIIRLTCLDHHLLICVPLMSIDNDHSLNSKLCTYNQDDVVFYYVNSHKAGWRAHKYLQNSEMIILWMQQTNPKLQSEWPWSRTRSYIVFTSGWQGWQGSSATKNNSQTFFSWKGSSVNVSHIIATSTRLPMSSTHVHNK